MYSQWLFFNDYDPQTAELFLLVCDQKRGFFFLLSYLAQSPIRATDHMLNNTAYCLLFWLHLVHSIF